MLPSGIDPIERSGQVVLTVRHEGKIVGLTSADFIRYHQLNDNLFYMFRMAVLPEFRVPGIESKLMVDSRDVLQNFAKDKPPANKAIGVLVFVENPKLKQNRNEAVWPASKLVYIGSDKQGRHIRVGYFKGATI
jgi:ribosomal protein S18 acetylase RimI-like enzyme